MYGLGKLFKKTNFVESLKYRWRMTWETGSQICIYETKNPNAPKLISFDIKSTNNKINKKKMEFKWNTLYQG